MLDISYIPSKVITHKLNIDPSFKSAQQKKRCFVPKKQKAIDEEVDKLLAIGFIREVHYPDWLVNIVMVKKSNKK